MFSSTFDITKKVFPLSIGIHFEVDLKLVLQDFISSALQVFFQAVLTMMEEGGDSLEYSLNCQGNENDAHGWRTGSTFYK